MINKLKLKAIMFFAILFSVVASTGTVVWANSQSVNVSYKTYSSGNGFVSGKSQGVWHYFSNGHKVTLQVKSKSGAGTSTAYLYRSTLLVDPYYGAVTASVGSHTFGKKTDATSGKYYLLFAGGNHDTTQKISGTIHD